MVASSSARHSHGERSLAGSGKHLERVEDLGGLVGAAEAQQAGAGEHDRVELAAGDLAEAGVDVAAEVDDLDPEAQGVAAGCAARRAGADAGTRAAARRG